MFSFQCEEGTVVDIPEDEVSGFGFSDVGYCTNCGNDQPAEPDARKYQCDVCDKHTVYGAPELLLMGALVSNG